MNKKYRTEKILLTYMILVLFLLSTFGYGWLELKGDALFAFMAKWVFNITVTIFGIAVICSWLKRTIKTSVTINELKKK